MKRTTTPWAPPKAAKSRISSSLTPRMSTQLTAAAIPSSTRCSDSRRVMAANRSGRSESHEMVTRRRPARRRRVATRPSVAPLVVMAKSVSNRLSFRTSVARSARTVGSPP